MKKIMMIAVMMVATLTASAQAGKVSLGANAGIAAYGNSYNPFGVGAKLQYQFTEDFRAELGYNYWFPKEKLGAMDFDLNIQYLIPAAYKLNIYPLVGVNLAKTHGSAAKDLLGKQQSVFGFQGGVGAEYYIADNVKLNFDVKYQYNKKTKETDGYGWEIKYDGPVFQVGIAYVF